MSKINPQPYGHRIRRERFDEYVISWITDLRSGRLRYPKGKSRDTTRKGAMRFAKKWGVRFEFPEEG